MEDELVQIFSTDRDSVAELVKSTLESYGITAILKQSIAHSVYPFTVDGLGEVKIMVLKADKEKAEEILKENFLNSEDNQEESE